MNHCNDTDQSATPASNTRGPTRCRLSAKAALGALLALPMSAAFSQQFTDASASAGLTYAGESFGASWGDYNGDGWPDLFVNRHRSRPALLLNLTDGTFQDRSFEVGIWNTFPFRDQHGGAWGDFDNDGDQDLMISLGSKDPTQFLVNVGGTLTDQISSFTIDPTPRWQGRMPMWFDFSGDGLLDFAMATTNGRFQLFRRSGSDFVKANSPSGNQCSDNPYGQLADVAGNGRLEWVCAAQAGFPNRIYETSQLPFIDVSAVVPAVPNTVDSIFADFDGDLDEDLLLVTGKVRVSGSEIVGPNSIQAHLIADLNAERGLTFQSAGDISVVLHWSKRNLSNVRIGASGFNPPPSPAGGPITFTLSASDPNVVGIQPHAPGDATAFYIGYDPGTQTWTYLSASGNSTAGGEGEWSYSYSYIDSTAPVSNLVNVGLSAGDMPSAPVYYRNDGGSFSNQTALAGLGGTIPCVSVAAADFDNDMDVDLYLVCRNSVSNAVDRLYSNQGGGVFTLVPNAGGATGPLGANAGLGENVVIADYDVDGFVDIFQTNGAHLFPENPYTAGGPEKLYRNTGNANRWVEVDLVGTTSNRDAIGAVVIATAGGVAQRRSQNGGYHRWAQHDRRLHFGLGSNDTVSLEIRWPDGTVDTFVDQPANALYRVSQDGTIEALDIVATPPPSPCGVPTFNKATEVGVFIWKDCPTNAWHVRVTGGGGTSTLTYVGNVTSAQPFQAVAGFSIEASDVLDTSDPNAIGYQLKVTGAAVDGFDFTVDGSGCFAFDSPAGVPVLLGFSRTVMPASFDLATFKECASLQPTVSIVGNVSVPEDVSNGLASFEVVLSAPSTEIVTVQFATANGSATDPDDYSATSGVVTFSPGETLQLIDVGIVDDMLSEGPESFSVTLSNPSNADLGASVATATIVDDEISACGAPTYDKASERAAFVWRDCPGNTWRVRVTGGGVVSQTTFVGAARSDQPFASVLGFSLELPSDILDAVTDPNRVSYSLIVNGSGQDGFDFAPANGAAGCFALDLPLDVPVLVGESKTPAPRSFDLATFGNCPF